MSECIQGTAGLIEVKHSAFASPKAIAIISHPHPLHGGNFDNKVVYTLAKACESQNIMPFRYNFRGVGETAGVHDHGVGELEDLETVLAYAKKLCPNLPVILAGFSFGAALSIEAAVRHPDISLITIAPPIYPSIVNIQKIINPWWFIMGQIDEVVEPQSVKDWLGKQKSPPREFWFDDAGHFFHGKLVKLRATLEDFL